MPWRSGAKKPQDPLVPLLITGAARRLLVGSEHYRSVYRSLTVGMTAEVTLRPDPGNRYDANAVVGLIDGQVCGYLAASVAALYQPLVKLANQSGYDVRASGVVEVIGGEECIRLQLPYPNALRDWLHLPVEQRATGFPQG